MLESSALHIHCKPLACSSYLQQHMMSQYCDTVERCPASATEFKRNVFMLGSASEYGAYLPVSVPSAPRWQGTTVMSIFNLRISRKRVSSCTCSSALLPLTIIHTFTHWSEYVQPVLLCYKYAEQWDVSRGVTGIFSASVAYSHFHSYFARLSESLRPLLLQHLSGASIAKIKRLHVPSKDAARTWSLR